MKVTTGQQNTAIGYQALAENTSGNNNSVAIGNKAVDNNTTGGNNTFLGSGTNVADSATFANSTAIGYEPKLQPVMQFSWVEQQKKTVMMGDASFNENVKIRGSLEVEQQQNTSIVNFTTTNYQLIVSEDISLNGRLFVDYDASFGGNIAFE